MMNIRDSLNKIKVDVVAELVDSDDAYWDEINMVYWITGRTNAEELVERCILAIARKVG